MYDYPGIEKGDLPLHKGQKVFIFDNSRDHWWRARNENGLVNKNVRMTILYIIFVEWRGLSLVIMSKMLD